MKRLQDEALDQQAEFTAEATDSDLTGAPHDPLTATFGDTTVAPADATAVLRCRKVESDPDQIGALGLDVGSAVTLRVEANGEFAPEFGMKLVFPYPPLVPDGNVWAVKSVKAIEQRGAAQIFLVVGSNE